MTNEWLKVQSVHISNYVVVYGINQFQAKESTDIPEEIYEIIKEELKVQRLTESIKKMPFAKAKTIVKEILKKIRYQKYYEHIPFIISKITGVPPIVLEREVEEKIKQMFKQIQEPFNRHCPANRLNFLGYSFILHKFFLLLGMKTYADCFILLKSHDKLRVQESIWKKICADLGWPFHPSI